MGPTNYGQHLFYLIWALITRLFFPIRHLRLIYELFKVSHPYEPFNLISKSHIPYGVVPYILMEGTILLNIFM